MENAKTAAKTIENKTNEMLSVANDRTKETMEKSAKVFEDMGSFGKGNLEAVVESSKIAMKGFEAMSQDAAAFAKKAFDDAAAQARTLASVKSPTEFFKLQGDFARQAFDAMIAESSKSTERMLKLAGEVAQPISNRMAVAAEKVKIAA